MTRHDHRREGRAPAWTMKVPGDMPDF